MFPSVEQMKEVSIKTCESGAGNWPLYHKKKWVFVAKECGNCMLFLNNKFPLYRGYKEKIKGKSTKPNPKGNRKTTKDNKKKKTS